MKKLSLRSLCKFSVPLCLFAGFALFFAPSHASAATQIYYSVGQNVNNHATGTGVTVSIDGSGVATFSVAQDATTTGIGDIVSYGGTSGSVFVTGKTSTTVWSVRTATGALPSATTSAPLVSIKHAFSSLRNAISIGVSGNATSSTFLNTSDLVAGNYVLNIPLYYDSGADATSVTIGGYTTDATRYIRIYTPTSTASEVNQTQRHGGRWTTTGAWRLEGNFSGGAGIIVNTANVRMDGLQVKNTTTSGTAFAVDYEVSGGTDNVYVSHSIFTTTKDQWTCLKFGIGGSSYQVHAWDNVLTNCSVGITANAGSFAPSQIYNNTFYDTVTGVNLNTTTAGMKLINNLFASTTNPTTITGKVLAGSDYNSTASTSIGYTVTGGGNTHDATSSAAIFVDTANIDFHLQTNDTVAKDTGKDVSADATTTVPDDIDGNARPFNSVYDRGADEWDGSTSDVTPPVVSNGSPSGKIATTTTSTTISVTTGENATCKYDTTANTAYASMANTFTTTGGQSHSQTVSGLSSGHSYNYYVRCQDTTGNANTSDFTISFYVATNGTAYANTCDALDVNIAIGIAIDGDTVQIPACSAGSYVWGSDTPHKVNVNKAITLQGTGTSTTVIAAGTGNSLAISSSTAVVKNFQMYADTNDGAGSVMISIGTTVDRWRVTGMYLDQKGRDPNKGTPDFFYILYVPNQLITTNSYGLFDGNQVVNMNNEVFFWRGPCNSWDIANSFGAANALFLENNIFTSTSSAYIDTNANGRLVARYNTLTAVYFDNHGMQSADDQCNTMPGGYSEGHHGSRSIEAYNNRFINPAAMSVYLRSGTGLIYNNTVEATSTNHNGEVWMEEYGVTQANTTQRFGFYYPTPATAGFACSAYAPIIFSIGRGMNSTSTTPHSGAEQNSEPVFFWNNTNATFGNTVGFDYGFSHGAGSVNARSACSEPALQVSDIIKQNINFCTHDTSTPCNGYNLSSYASYTCPHPLTGLTGGCNTSIAGTAGYNSSASPTVTTSSASSITATAATLNGSVTATGGASITQHGFEYGTVSNMSTITGTTTLGTQSGTGSFSSSISSLSCNTTYYTRAYATNMNGTSYGSIVSFLTSPCVQTLSTNAASSITRTTATINAAITATGGADATQSGFAYGTVSNLATTIATSSIGAQTGTASFNQSLTGLTCNTTYYFRPYTDNSAGRSIGSIGNFTTSACVAPTVTVQAASSLSTTGALLNGTVTDAGGLNDTVQGFQYGPTTSYGATTSTSGSYAAGSFSQAISGLTCATTYHFNAFATNIAGTGYSGDQPFTTASCPFSAPTISTNAASSVTATAATLNGNIAANGGADATQSGFAYGTASDLSTVIATSTLGAQTGTASFSAPVSSLSCNTTYYFRAYATNTGGTGYGSIQSFLTSPCVPVVTVQSATSIGLNSVTLNETIVDLGGTTTVSRGFEYGLTVSYGSTFSRTGSFTTGAYGSTISGLSCGTTYHFRGFAANSAGTGSSSDSTFITLSCQAPTVLSLAASSVNQTTATLNGSISVQGGVDATDSGFAWSAVSDLSSAATTTLGAQTGTASFGAALTGLACATPYYFRAYAINTGGTSYGSIASFTTSDCTATSSNPVSSVLSFFSGGASTARREANLARVADTVSATRVPVSSLSSLIAALVKAGVIPPDKAAMAEAALSAKSVSAPKVNLGLNNKGESVRSLQALLNAKGFTIAKSGAGSPGRESTVFGPATAKALKAFQKANGIPATGFYGPLTRAALAK